MRRGLFLFAALLLLSTGPSQEVPTFREEGKRRGLKIRYRADMRRAKMIATMGGGVAAGDYDGDGFIDLYLLSGVTDARTGEASVPTALYHNRGDGTFEEVAAKAGVALQAWAMGAIFADTNGDGRLDLYVTCLGKNRLFQNQGDGTFQERGEAAGIADPLFGTGAAFADFDRDEDLDLILVNYLASTPEEEMAAKQFLIRTPVQYEGQPTRLFLNQGDGTFVDRTEAAGTDNRDGKGLGVRVFDADLDGWQDIYIANDTVPNKLYRNLGVREGTVLFEDLGIGSGAAVSSTGKPRAGMGIALGDADMDGDEDLLVTNFGSEPNSYFQNQGDNLFLEIGGEVGLASPSLPYVSWGASFLDADLDGDLDLVTASGHLVSKIVRIFGHTSRKEDRRYLKGPWKCPVQLYLNQDGSFQETVGRAGDLSHLELAGRGLAAADIDRDGDLDVVVSARDRGAALFMNDASQKGNHWLVVSPRQQGKNPFAVGSRVLVTEGSQTMARTICDGSSYAGSEPLEAHFGLGRNIVADKVTVIWPDQTTQTMSSVKADQVIVVDRR